MKIVKMILENFEAVKYCLNTSYLELDLDKCENNICLLIGPNGSGKTTILSLLTPFSTVGNLDVRDGYHLIIPHKEGKKEIWYKKGGNLYTIQHFYTPTKETHSTKSFIQLNGEELNPNGNVTSFKEIVKTHLGIELGYLKLTRLGSNVKSLIESSSTERKTFMGKLLDEIGVYLDYYKHVNNNLRTLKDMISHAVDQSKKMLYEDRKTYETEIEEYDQAITSLEKGIREHQDSLAVYTAKLNDLGNVDDIRTKLAETGKAFKKMQKTRDRLGDDVREASYYREKYEEACAILETKENMVNTTTALLNRELSTRNELEERVHKLTVRVEKETSVDKELERLYSLLEDTEDKIKAQKKLLKNFDSSITVHDYENFLVYVKASQQTISRLYEFGNDPMKEVVRLIRNKENVEHYISSGLLEGEHQDDDETFLRTLKAIITNNDPICDKSGCAGFKIVKHINTLLEDRAARATKRDNEYYQMMHHIYQGLYPVLEGFHPYGTIITNLPEKIQNQFKMTAILDRLEKGEPIYDAKRMDQFYTMLKEKEELEKRKGIEEDIRKQIHTYETFSQSKDLKEDLSDTTDSLQTCKNKISEYRESLAELRGDIQEYTYTAESMEDAMNTCEHYEDTRDAFNEYQKLYDTYHECMSSVTELQQSIRRLSMDCENLRIQRGKVQSGLTLYLDNRKNLKTYRKHFDNMTLVRQSLSANKGIPTIIVKHYLKDTVEMTNELLDIAYNGNIILADFNIDADEFTMPVYNRGQLLPDVKLLSQGELALISVALSFALVSQSLNGYNIMSLDEIDGALDTNNRRNFLLIMERQIDRIGSEQNFMITHNDAFSSYPVDIIDLSGKNDNEMYPYATYIPIIKSKGENK